MNVIIELVIMFILVCPVFAAILWLTSRLARKFSVNSLFIKGIFVAIVGSLIFFFWTLIVGGDLMDGIINGFLSAIILTFLSVGAFWLTRKLGRGDKILIPVIILSCVFVLIFIFIRSANDSKRAEVAPSAVQNVGISDYEQQVLGIMHELEKKGVLSDLPKNLDKMLLGSASSLGAKDNIDLLADSKRIHNAALKAIGELERQTGRDMLLDLMVASYFGKKEVSFLDTAGLDYVGRSVFYAEVKKRKNMHVKEQ